jgi:hypothetical protein
MVAARIHEQRPTAEGLLDGDGSAMTAIVRNLILDAIVD